MAIQDDFTIDYTDRKITYSTAFVDDRPDPTKIYTANEVYSYLQDTFDEPAQMSEPIPMSAQTPTQYTLLYPWFMDNESMKAIYGGSIQTSGWTQSGSEGITATHWASATSAPESGDIGKAVTGTSGATGVILAVDAVRQVVWIRNTNATAFGDSDVIDDDATGTDPDYTTDADTGSETGENIWANLFSVGTLQTATEVYVGQEPDQLGGTAYHDADPDSKFERRIEKLDEWWDSDTDFATGSPNLLGGAGHFDILVLTQEMNNSIDSGRLFVGARQFGKVYSHFELIAAVAGNFVVPFAATAADLNSADGPYNATFSGRAGTDMAVGDILENGTEPPSGRLRGVVTAVVDGDQATGDIDFYLIGDTEPLTTTDRTLLQFTNTENILTRGTSTNDFEIGTPTLIGPSTAQGITLTFASTQQDVDEDLTDEDYALTLDCNNVPLSDVYKRLMFLCSRGNQDGTVADTQDTILQSADVAIDEAGEFYRAVGDIIISWDARASAGITEDQLVKGSLSGATGVVTAANTTATGIGVLTAVKGTFEENDVVSDIDDGATNTVTLDATAFTVISDNTAAPFGTFAGGRFFFARGIYPTNVPSADANNWETIALGSTAAVAPPAQRLITFNGLASTYRAAIFEVSTAGGIDIDRAQNGIAAGGEAIGSTVIDLDASVANDVPSTGWIRVVDDGTPGTEYRYEYTSYATTAVTLRTGAGLAGTAEVSGASTTVLVDTAKFGSFGSDGELKVGMMIRDTVTDDWAVVLRGIDANSVETTPISGGTWATTNAWAANEVVVALVDADTVYFGYIDDVSSGTELTKTVKFDGVTELLARMRFSDPDIGGQRVLPYERLNFQLTDADLTVTAVVNDDLIAS